MSHAISEQQLLSFSLTSTLEALLPTQQLTEILNLSIQQIVPIPDTAAQIMGVCNWRGEVLWLIDLGYLLGAEPLFSQSHRHKGYKAIVVQSQGHALGLVVGQVKQMIWCDLAQVQAMPNAPLAPELETCLQGYWLSPQNETFLVLDGETIVDFFRSQYL